jgi:hypothetical protein
LWSQGFAPSTACHLILSLSPYPSEPGPRIQRFLEMMKGSDVDVDDDLTGQSFRIKNPNAVASVRLRGELFCLGRLRIHLGGIIRNQDFHGRVRAWQCGLKRLALIDYERVVSGLPRAVLALVIIVIDAFRRVALKKGALIELIKACWIYVDNP